jgi:hypothetical protein
VDGDGAAVSEGGGDEETAGDGSEVGGAEPSDGDEADDWAGSSLAAGFEEESPVGGEEVTLDAPGEADGLVETLGDAPAEAAGEPAPAEAAAEPGDADCAVDGFAPFPSGVDAWRAGGGDVETPGWRIGAIGGCLGRGCGVRPDTHA